MIDNLSERELLDKSLLEIDEHLFYNAHETLESIWFARRFEKNNEILLIKGLINATVSLELLKRGREEASKKAWKVYLKYRPLLYKTTSPHLNKFHEIARHLEKIKNKNRL